MSLPSESHMARFDTFGPPEEVVSVAKESLPTTLRSDQILVRMLAASINPADINFIQGVYGIRPELPAIPGNEGVGVIDAVGGPDAGRAVGDWVRLPSGTGCWREYAVVPGEACSVLPKGLTPEQAASISVNPPTAWRMIHDFVSLKPGDWLAQNAANSAVGRAVIQIAHSLGIKTINMVRRPGLEDELKALGADVVLIDEPACNRNFPNAPLVAFNAVGGPSAIELAKGLAPGGTLVTYGAMGKQPLTLSNSLLIFKDLRFRGFWMTRWLQKASSEEAASMFEKIANLMRTGKLHIPVDQVYPLDQIMKALQHAQEEKRKGKILLTLDPMHSVD